jgi:hypothetical protein
MHYNPLKHEIVFSNLKWWQCVPAEASAKIMDGLQHHMIFYFDFTGWIQPLQVTIHGPQC